MAEKDALPAPNWILATGPERMINMANDYIPRRSSSGNPYYASESRKSSPQRGQYPPRRPPQRRRRRSGPPPLLILALLLIAAIVAVVLILVFAGRQKDPASSPASSSAASPASSQASSAPASGTSAPVSSQPQTSSGTTSATPPPEQIPSGVAEKLGTHFRIGNTGYEYYNFNESAANQYITLVSDAGKELAGAATLYDMIIPTSIDITLPESYLEENEVNSQDQRKAIEEYIYPSITGMNPDVKTVSIFDALKLHNNEYIYFRTDHHWTQLGAYYAYVEFCKAKGIEPVALDQFEKKEYPGFLGSFYSDEINDDMENDPDTVEAYLPKANTSMYVLQQDGEALEDWPVIQDGTDYSEENKYLIFCAGDQPYEEITNSDLSDGSSCVVVKESFGNAFIPFLVNHYQTIYVVDYRYYQGNIAQLVKDKGAKDLILVNNISMTRNEELVNALDNSF